MAVTTATTHFVPELRSHSQRVCTLYKEAMRLVEAYYSQRNCVRYHQVILRAEFDKNKCVEDPKEMRRLLWVGKNELFEKQHPIPCGKFPKSFGICRGTSAGRIVESPDWVLDYWHPLEKAQYPEYFKRREQRKQEYVKLWESNTVL